MILSVFRYLFLYFVTIFGVYHLIGADGLWASAFTEGAWWKLIIYAAIMGHLTITAMSLSFHRFHTHKGVILNSVLDSFMQVWLWMVTSMSKADWVGVHTYHHAYSDKEKDPHSPVHKGFWHVFILGAYDYSIAKSSAPVMKIKKTIKHNKLESFIAAHPMMGISTMTFLCLVVFGPLWGSVIALVNFAISPLFAVGGVNALAHWWGYRNHKSGDNSRNIGFLFPLNFIICGELDHNNHHAHQKSCSFRHRWFEFDIGYLYIILLTKMKLAKVVNAYTPKNLKEELSEHLKVLIEKDYRFKKRFEELCREMNVSYHELLKKSEDYLKGKKVELERPVLELLSEVRRTWWANMKLNLSY